MCTSSKCYIGTNDIVLTFFKIGLLQGHQKNKKNLKIGYICDDCSDILDLCRKFVTEHTFVFHHIDNFTAKTSYIHCIEDIVEPIIKVLFETGCSDGRVLGLMMVLSRIMMNYSNEGSVSHLQDSCIKYVNHNILPSYDWVKFEKFVRVHCCSKQHKSLEISCQFQKYVGTVLFLVNVLVTLYKSFVVK